LEYPVIQVSNYQPPPKLPEKSAVAIATRTIDRGQENASEPEIVTSAAPTLEITTATTTKIANAVGVTNNKKNFDSLRMKKAKV
jgi:hypothetical protein